MFSTCIHCAASLGRNEAFELFPIGSRLAFDPARGRLWVVCRACDRWNLSPLDERWEAVEAAERQFRASRLRVSTDHIGLARLREGVDLIRIGDPQRPEMAAWRYGDTFGRRRRRQLLVTGAVAGSAAVVLGGLVVAGISVLSFGGVYANGALWGRLVHGRPGKVVARVRSVDGRQFTVTRALARMSVLEKSDGADQLWLRLRHTEGETMLHGDDAMCVAAKVLPTVNRFGGSRATVQQAVTLLETSGDSRTALSQIQRGFGAQHAEPVGRVSAPWGGEFVHMNRGPGVLHAMPAHVRLALEMALHEDRERRAMEGELALLQRAWRDAEEIAKIADNMFISASVDARVNAIHTARADIAVNER